MANIASSRVRIANGQNGTGVFATKDIPTGERILSFTGNLYRSAELPEIHTPKDDRFIQVGPDLFMGPSGNTDDFVNHSCDPNSGVVISHDDISLIAIRTITPGEEVEWDYSTTMFQDAWTMRCHCGTPACRGVIREFSRLPGDIQNRYIDLGIVPAYNLDPSRSRPKPRS